MALLLSKAQNGAYNKEVMRPIWKGSISFGLINIPVRLYSATAGTELSFKMLHAEDMGPISYVKVCKKDGKEVPFQDIVKGYEYQKGDYVIMTDEDFEHANVKKSHTIDIQDFVKETEIDDIYFEKPYYLEPEKGAEKPYALLRDALAKSGKVGIAKFVLRSKENLAALKTSGQVIVLEQMRYHDEIRAQEDLKLPGSEATKKEVDIALALIEQLTAKFDATKFHDTYKKDVMDMIKAKAKGKTVKVAEGTAPKETEVKDLMAMLKASLEKQKEPEEAKK